MWADIAYVAVLVLVMWLLERYYLGPIYRRMDYLETRLRKLEEK